jgi:hypothetical protein
MVKMTIGTSVGQPVRRPGNVAPGRPATVAPALLRAPQLSGTGRIGAALTADPGLWSGTPAPSLALNWQRDGMDIPGATGTGYVPGPADDLRAIRCRVTATNAAGTASAVTVAVTATHAAPVRSGTLPDLAFDLGSGPQTVAAADVFAGSALTYGASGAGAVIDPATGALTLATDLPRAGERITVTATNSGGTAAAEFRLTVAAARRAPVALTAPSLSGIGRIGSALTVDPGSWDGDPAPSLGLRWQRDGVDISGAMGTSYTPEAADDLRAIRCVVRATNAEGTTEAATAAVSVTYVAPVRTGALSDLVFERGTGLQMVPTAQGFTGANLRFYVSGANASIDPITGIIVLSTEELLASTIITVRAENSGGSASAAFQVSIEPSQTQTDFAISASSQAPSSVTIEITGDPPPQPFVTSPAAETVRVEFS